MAEIFETAIVEKRNVLNELRATNLTLQELRFFSIYLSKINPYDKKTKDVRFPLSDFQKIMEFGRLNIQQLKESTDSLLGKKVHIPLESGGFKGIVLFDQCEVNKDIHSRWYVEISASNAALPLMFDFKDRYFKYELWNALRLKSANQIRMYEILKQYEKLGKREIAINDLRELLGIAPNEYPRWNNFKTRVLDSCQQALKEITDISFEYERGKVGNGGKWLSIIFQIEKNTEYKDALSLEEFIEIQPLIESDFAEYHDETEINYGSELANLLGSAALNDEFSIEQVEVIKGLVIQAVKGDDIERCDYLHHMVSKMNVNAPKNRYSYLCAMIENDINEDK